MKMETFLIIHVSFQVGSLKTNCDIVKMISDCRAKYTFLPSTIIVLLFPLYAYNFAALAAIVYKENCLITQKCGQCRYIFW